MQTLKKNYTTVDEYIASYPADVKHRLQEVRRTIRDAVPEAEEKISYQMPAFMLDGALVYFGAFKNHIGFYPTASGIANFREEIKDFTHSKGAVQFPLDQPLPLDLIAKIARHRATENRLRATKKRKTSAEA